LNAMPQEAVQSLAVRLLSQKQKKPQSKQYGKHEVTQIQSKSNL